MIYTFSVRIPRDIDVHLFRYLWAARSHWSSFRLLEWCRNCRPSRFSCLHHRDAHGRGRTAIATSYFPHSVRILLVASQMNCGSPSLYFLTVRSFVSLLCSILIMQHWVALIAYNSRALYSSIELVLDYYFQWSVLCKCFICWTESMEVVTNFVLIPPLFTVYNGNSQLPTTVSSALDRGPWWSVHAFCALDVPPGSHLVLMRQTQWQ